MRVCQFRHDGKWTVNCNGWTPPHQEDLLSYSTDAKLHVKPRGSRACRVSPMICKDEKIEKPVVEIDPTSETATLFEPAKRVECQEQKNEQKNEDASAPVDMDKHYLPGREASVFVNQAIPKSVTPASRSS